MKIFKLLFVLVVVSALTFSCKSEKKEGAQDESAVEMSEEGSTDESSAAAEASEEGASSEASSGDGAAAAAGTAGAAAAASSTDETAAPAEGVEGSSKGVEEMSVAEGVMTEELADTPAIYPGCAAETTEALRACNKAKFIEFIKKEFNQDIANGLGVDPGPMEINTIVQVSAEGKCSAIRVTTPHYKLENEMKRVIAAVPQVTPATHKGQSVPVTFKLPFTLQVGQALIEK